MLVIASTVLGEIQTSVQILVARLKRTNFTRQLAVTRSTIHLRPHVLTVARARQIAVGVLAEPVGPEDMGKFEAGFLPC